MTIDLNEEDSARFYTTACQKYHECLRRKDNSFLQDEVNFPIEAMEVKKSNIKMVFGEGVSQCSFEIELALLYQDKIVGKYTYMQDRDGNGLEDMLVFF